jgi:hypothetical protein
MRFLLLVLLFPLAAKLSETREGDRQVGAGGQGVRRAG